MKMAAHLHWPQLAVTHSEVQPHSPVSRDATDNSSLRHWYMSTHFRLLKKRFSSDQPLSILQHLPHMVARLVPSHQ